MFVSFENSCRLSLRCNCNCFFHCRSGRHVGNWPYDPLVCEIKVLAVIQDVSPIVAFRLSRIQLYKFFVSRLFDRSVATQNRRETGTEKRHNRINQFNYIRYHSQKTFNSFYENRKLGAKKRKIRKPQRTTKPKNRELFWHKNRKPDLQIKE